MTRYYYENPWIAGYMMTEFDIPLMWQGDPWLVPVTLAMLTDDIDARRNQRYYVQPGYLDSITVDLVLRSQREGQPFHWPKSEEEA